MHSSINGIHDGFRGQTESSTSRTQKARKALNPEYDVPYISLFDEDYSYRSRCGHISRAMDNEKEIAKREGYEAAFPVPEEDKEADGRHIQDDSPTVSDGGG